MKSALIALGTLALGASAWYFLDPSRARSMRARRLPVPYRSPISMRQHSSPPAEPGEIEEITGTTLPSHSSH